MTEIYTEAELATEFADTDQHKVHSERPTKVVVNLEYHKDYDPDALFTALAALGTISANQVQPQNKPIMNLKVS